MSRRRFGTLRQLPSGRWQASYLAPDGTRVRSPDTYASKRHGGEWLSLVEADLLRGEWRDRDASREALGPYISRWLAQHPQLGPRWRETCERNLRLHLRPLATVPLGDLTPGRIREWRAAALAKGAGGTSIAQSYRFLRAVLNTAVEDQIIARNPCRIRGAGVDRAAERPTATADELDALIGEMPGRYKAAVALGGWCGLRRGEVLGLERADIDIAAATVTVRRTQTEMLSTTELFDSLPKTDAGYRTVSIPPHVMPIVAAHLDAWAGTVRVFVGKDGTCMRANALRLAYERARARAGLEHLRFHDLRHTGQTLAAAAGASMADLMKRLGHSSPAAARRYLHASDDRDALIAAAMSSSREPLSAADKPPFRPDR